jgi:hypothetical protein
MQHIDAYSYEKYHLTPISYKQSEESLKFLPQFFKNDWESVIFINKEIRGLRKFGGRLPQIF